MSRTPKKLERAQKERTLARLNRDARVIAERFGLRFREILAERAGVKNRYGVCYDDGTIKIRLIHSVTGAPLRYSSLVDTLCHELAHLKYWHHGPGFVAYYKRLLRFARAQGIYTPTRRTRNPARPADAARPLSAEGVEIGLVDDGLQRAPKDHGRTDRHARGRGREQRSPDSATPQPASRLDARRPDASGKRRPVAEAGGARARRGRGQRPASAGTAAPEQLALFGGGPAEEISR